jgi:hypothetical protein
MSNQNSINSQDVLKSFKSNNKERFWKEKIIALAVLFFLGLILYFIFRPNNEPKDFTSRFQGNIATKTNLILYLSAKDGQLNGYYYDFCDSTKKINIKGTLNKNGAFDLNEMEENNPNSPSLKGSIGEDGSLSGERSENYGNSKLSFYFSRITLLPSITCQGITERKQIQQGGNTTTVINVPQPIKLVVNGKDLSDLRIKLDKKTKNIMKSINYVPENSYLDIANFKFTCDLIPDSSANFSKIGLFYGPKSNGYCESCSNVLNKNSGSEELIKDEDNNYFYSVIALPR